MGMGPCAKPTTLALYDPEAKTTISADASSHGLGAVLLQQVSQGWKPVAYASRSMSETEKRYAQIEKEALATTWACEKFSDFITGKSIRIETDHKPLVPLLGTKHLDSLPPRILRFRLRLDRFDYTIEHVPGKELYTADTLSRAPTGIPPSSSDSALEQLAELLAIENITHLPASASRLEIYRKAQRDDPACSLISQYCRDGWPGKKSIDTIMKPFWEARGNLTFGDGLLLFDNRIVIPESLREETLKKLHEGHQGITRCRLRARVSVWWPGLSKHLSDYVSKCPECIRDSTPHKEPLIPTPLPQYPWQQVGSDLFTLKGVNYLVVVDYFSRYPEVTTLKTTTSDAVISAMKATFARHGVPETVVSDNGPQYSSQEFADFAKSYNFTHKASSPHYPQSNGHVERAVKTVKGLLRDSCNSPKALLSFRSTPLPWCELSPAELLMGRKIRSDIPQTTDSLTPQWPYLVDFRHRHQAFKLKQKHNYDQRHRVRDLPAIPDNTEVWVTDGAHPVAGRTVSPAAEPRSYYVETPSGTVRRNRSHLNIGPSTSPTDSSTDRNRSPIKTRSRTGTVITPPDRLS